MQVNLLIEWISLLVWQLFKKKSDSSWMTSLQFIFSRLVSPSVEKLSHKVEPSVYYEAASTTERSDGAAGGNRAQTCQNQQMRWCFCPPLIEACSLLARFNMQGTQEINAFWISCYCQKMVCIDRTNILILLLNAAKSNLAVTAVCMPTYCTISTFQVSV